ncbi:hypothetical protein PLESTB_000199400 [Pleodorina starrii]|uniref:RWD domain-containing protein n=1 Tax=Pleodorina starrii TaxID=330485 RepID=A0A9W6BCG8_9CHLO|nr:hypothetical protein PLESTM_000332400 [Pleodorina starrii]GLC49255.1 hypothetical protein PLESTB_000199400 [Pleodorina starrii]GLC73491.1 hypothetical protein PLESTF_001383500 [Pleodorina starrii]
MEGALEIELEALTATFADDVTIEGPSSDKEYPTTIMFRLAPRDADSHDAFVAATLRLHLPSSYPEASPHIELLDTKGIGDQRLEMLHQRLCEEASTLAGEMALGALCEHALDWITEQNRPEGLCAFCLCAMRPGPDPDAAALTQAQALTGAQTQAAQAQPLVRLPCFHAFHRDCYTGWWSWLQLSLEARERELVKHTGASAASVLREQDLPARDPHGVYETSCPVCRAPAPLDCLGPQLRDELVAAAAAADADAAAPSCCDGRGGARPSEHKAPRGGAQQRNGQGRQPHQQQQQQQPCRGARGQGWQEDDEGEGEVEAPRHRLSAAELAGYREVQARHARVLARQRAAGGLIEQACYSIAGWTLGPEPAGGQGQGQGQGREEEQPLQGPGQPSGEEEAGQQVSTQQRQQQQRQQQQRHKGGDSMRGLNGGGGGGGGGRNAPTGPARAPCVLRADATGSSQSEQVGSGHDGHNSGPREQRRGRGGGPQQQRRQPQQQQERQEGNQRRPGTGQVPPGGPASATVEATGGGEVPGSGASARWPEAQGSADAAAAAVVASALRGVCGRPVGDPAPATGASAGGGRNRGGGGGGGGRGGGGAAAGADGPRGAHRPSSGVSAGCGLPPGGASPTSAAASSPAPSCGGSERGSRAARNEQPQPQQRQQQRTRSELSGSGSGSGGADLGSGGAAAGGRSEAGGGGRGGGPGRRARQQQGQGQGQRPRGEPRPSDL